jgi:hypothetical protein
MISSRYKVFGKSDYALLQGDHAVVQCLLQDDGQWGAHVLEMAGENGWKIHLLRPVLKLLPSCIEPADEISYLAISLSGEKSFLCYQFTSDGSACVRIEPAGILPKWFKIATGLLLTSLLIFPVLFAPLLWRSYRDSSCRSSKLYLDALCRYLDDRLPIQRNDQ